MIQNGRIAGSGRNGLPESKPYVYRGTGTDETPEPPRLREPLPRVRPAGYREQENEKARARRAADDVEFRSARSASQRSWRARQAVT